MTTQKRLPGIDELRGVMMVLVVLYHLGYDLNVFYGVPMEWFWRDWPVQGFRDCFTGALMAVSGLSCLLSRSNLRRGLRLLCVAAGLTLATVVFAPQQAIWFGILHYFAACMLLWALLGPAVARIPPRAGMALSAVLFAVLRFIDDGFLLLPGLGRLALPGGLYQTRWLFWLGLPHPSFYSADYYPLLPWGLLFLFGAFLGLHWRRAGFPRGLYRARVPALGWMGRHSLMVYLVHQPILLGVLWLLMRRAAG